MTLPDRSAISLRGLQVFMLVNAVVAILGGGSFVFSGIDGVERVLGIEYPELKPMLGEAAASMAAEPRVSFDHFYRVLGWYWLMTGAMLLWITPSVASRTAWFRFLHIGFMAVGVSNILSMAEYGTNAHLRPIALVPELGIPCAAMLWQTFVARGARNRRASGLRRITGMRKAAAGRRWHRNGLRRQSRSGASAPAWASCSRSREARACRTE